MNSSSTRPLRIAVLISGGGTTLQNLIACVREGRLQVEIGLVISSRRDAAGLEYATADGIAHQVVRREEKMSDDDYRDAIFQPCRDAKIGLVVMGGFLKHVLIPNDFAGRVMNIHPSLIPAFCGKGFFGRRVHEAVLDYGAKVTGCTVHFVDNQYDHGPIIAQRVVPVHDDDTPDSLAARVFQQECSVYPEVIGQFADGRLKLNGRQVRLTCGQVNQNGLDS